MSPSAAAATAHATRPSLTHTQPKRVPWQGYEVDIYESRAFIGGKVASWVKDGNHVEMGLHVVRTLEGGGGVGWLLFQDT